ncbi:MAG: FMN-binding glutamate synthase family protein, partial [Actinomycetota bacterium]|nr:FMN-binding glutamate synthase family protein [Actinomycetota bacterium]
MEVRPLDDDADAPPPGELIHQRESPVWPRTVIDEIQLKAQLGRYHIQGFSMRRSGVPTLDDLTFVPCTLSRVPLEGYREKCSTDVELGGRHGATPVRLERPITIA